MAESFSKMVENTEGKGEIARYEQFLLLPQCFLPFFNLTKMAESFSKMVENTEGKGEIARYEQFLLLPQCFQKTCTADM